MNPVSQFPADSASRLPLICILLQVYLVCLLIPDILTSMSHFIRLVSPEGLTFSKLYEYYPVGSAKRAVGMCGILQLAAAKREIDSISLNLNSSPPVWKRWKITNKKPVVQPGHDGESYIV